MEPGTKKKAIIAGALAAVALVGAAGGVAASGAGDRDEPITGDPLVSASNAALEDTGGGRVTDTEAGDEESYYEVEVTLEDGSEVDVQIDEDFNVVGSAADDEPEDDDGDAARSRRTFGGQRVAPLGDDPRGHSKPFESA